jgi:hypothetical protein
MHGSAEKQSAAETGTATADNGTSSAERSAGSKSGPASGKNSRPEATTASTKDQGSKPQIKPVETKDQSSGTPAGTSVKSADKGSKPASVQTDMSAAARPSDVAEMKTPRAPKPQATAGDSTAGAGKPSGPQAPERQETPVKEKVASD